jgi:hypothetical protein
MRKQARNYWIFVISHCEPSKHVCYLVHSALLKAKQHQKPSTTV